MIDGYPRNMENLNGILEAFGDSLNIVCALHLTCNEECCVARLLNRGQSSGRADDAEEVIKKRFNTFYNESLPVVEKLKEKATMVEVDSTKSPEEVTKNVIEEMSKLIK